MIDCKHLVVTLFLFSCAQIPEMGQMTLNMSRYPRLQLLVQLPIVFKTGMYHPVATFFHHSCSAGHEQSRHQPVEPQYTEQRQHAKTHHAECIESLLGGNMNTLVQSERNHAPEDQDNGQGQHQQLQDDVGIGVKVTPQLLYAFC